MKFLSNYLNWHYIYVFSQLLTLWGNLTIFPIYFFSVPSHLATLFKPWKKQTIRMKPGFHVDDFLGVISFNLISRSLGALLRVNTILLGILSMIIFTVLGFLMIVVWLLIPFITIPFYIMGLNTGNTQSEKLINQAKNNLRTLTLLLLNHPFGKQVCWRLGVNPLILSTNITQIADQGDYQVFLSNLNQNKKKVDLTTLTLAVFSSFDYLKKILSEKNLNLQDVLETCIWCTTLSSKKRESLIWNRKKIQSLSGIGSDWAYGYTVDFDKYSFDLTSHHTPYPLLIGREKELEKMQQILLKTEGNNILLIGESGVGRHILVETLAYRMLTGACQPTLSHKRILALDMHTLVSSRSSILEVKGIASNIISEAVQAGNIIVMIDDIDKYVTSGEGRVDLSDVIAKFSQSSLGLIGITDLSSYHRYIEPNSGLSNVFEKIRLEPPPMQTLMIEIQYSIVPVLESKHHIFITLPSVKKAIEDANRYITTTPFPGKVIELLDEACVYLVTIKKGKLLLSETIDEYLTQKLNIPIGKLKSSEKQILVNLENYLHLRVQNQNQAISAISSALRRGRLGISSPNKPIGSFLFLGPTGVGKTETAKALAESYYGDENNMLRFDMSQYQKEEGLERLIGSIKIGTAGELTSKLKDHPFSLLLLDEIEKADNEIYNLYLSLIDEGYISDALGRKIDAKNTIIIATSNAGAEYIREFISKNRDLTNIKKDILEHLQKERIFSPEFLNRFDEVVVFTPLSEGHLREIAKIMLVNLNKRLSEKEISVAITDDLIKKLAILGFDPQFGARAIRRVIAEKIEDIVAQKLLSGDAKKGEPIYIDL